MSKPKNDFSSSPLTERPVCDLMLVRASTRRGEARSRARYQVRTCISSLQPHASPAKQISVSPLLQKETETQTLRTLRGSIKVAQLVSSEMQTTHKSTCLQNSCPRITHPVKPHCAHLVFHSRRPRSGLPSLSFCAHYTTKMRAHTPPAFPCPPRQGLLPRGAGLSFLSPTLFMTCSSP